MGEAIGLPAAGTTPKVAFAGIGIVLLLLLVVYITDSATHRWLHAGLFSVQPSEFAKPALALFLAYFLSHRTGAINDRHTLLPIALSISAVAFFVAVADFGTAVVLVAMTVMVVFVAGLDTRYLWATVALGSRWGCVYRDETLPAEPRHRFFGPRSQTAREDRPERPHSPLREENRFDQRPGLSAEAGEDCGGLGRIRSAWG